MAFPVHKKTSLRRILTYSKGLDNDFSADWENFIKLVGFAVQNDSKLGTFAGSQFQIVKFSIHIEDKPVSVAMKGSVRRVEGQAHDHLLRNGIGFGYSGRGGCMQESGK